LIETDWNLLWIKTVDPLQTNWSSFLQFWLLLVKWFLLQLLLKS
jgi:hypothetical protein